MPCYYVISACDFFFSDFISNRAKSTRATACLATGYFVYCLGVVVDLLYSEQIVYLICRKWRATSAAVISAALSGSLP